MRFFSVSTSKNYKSLTKKGGFEMTVFPIMRHLLVFLPYCLLRPDGFTGNRFNHNCSFQLELVLLLLP